MPNRRQPPRHGPPPKRRAQTPSGPSRRPPQGRPTNRPAPAQPPAAARERGRKVDDHGPGEERLDRLQKVLAHAGVSLRRACEELILQGRVTVDGVVVRELGTRVDARRQQVAVDGQKVHSERNVYYAVHKPKGYVSTNNDPSGKPRVIDLLPEIPQRVYAVGRLDEQSTGLMLLTNDGELANKLAHPKFGVEKVYRVVVAGEPGREILDKLTQGVWLAEGKVRAKRVKITGRKGQASILEMVLAEGKNREIRRMLAQLGHKVMSLTRIAVGPIGLKGIGIGECRPLTGREIDLLRKVALGLFIPAPRFADRRERTPRPESTRRPARPPVESPEGPGSENRPPRAGSKRPATAGPMPQGSPRPKVYNGPPGRPSTGQAARPPQANRPQQGPPRRLTTGAGPRPAQGGARRPLPPKREEDSVRKIIGLDNTPHPERSGPAGPRLRRPVPKRSPRAALGIKRFSKKDEDSGTSGDS